MTRRLKFLLGLLMFFLILWYIHIDWDIVEGRSMEPSMESGDILISIRPLCIKKGDIILLKSPLRWLNEKSDVWCKRVGDLTDSTVYVLGDNPDHSFDSRYIGYIARTNILKKVICIYHIN